MDVMLWSIQHADAWEELQRTGVLCADPERADGAFLRAYEWMARQMRSRIGPPPEGVCYPLWAWYQWEGRRRRRDLRCSGYGPRGAPLVQIAFEIHPDRILLSEFDRWHTVLSGGYLAADEQDWNQSRGCEPEASWERIFDLDRWTQGWDAPPEEQTIQAVLWELRLEQVRKVEHFTAK